jgi:MFS family permease
MGTKTLSLSAVRGHWRLLGAFGIDALGSGLFLPFSILFFTATTPLSLQHIGLALSIAALVRLPATAAAGMLTDLIGPKRAVIGSNLAQSIGFAGYIFVGSFTQVLLGAVVIQVGNSVFWVAYPALVHEVADRDSEERWFALINAMRNAGLAVGALGASLAVAIGGTAGYRVIVAVNALSFALAATLTRLNPASGARPERDDRSPERPSGSWSAVLHDRPFLGFVAVNVGFALLSLSFVIAVPVFLVASAGLPNWTPGTLLALNAVLGTLAAAPVVAAISGRRRDHVLISSQVIIGLGYCCVLLADLVPPILKLGFALLAAVLVTTTELIQGPAVNAIVNEFAPDGNRGRYIGVYQMTFVLVDIVAPLTLTTALAHGAFATWVPLIAIAAVDALVLVFLARHSRLLALRIGHTSVTDPTLRPGPVERL